MKAIVIGGSGATGKYLVRRLLADDRFDEIVLLLRKPAAETHPKIKQVIVDFDKLNDFAEQINGDVAFSCLGTTLKDAGSKEAQWKVDYDYQYNFAKIARQNGIATFVLMSAQNADAKSSFFYSRMKGELEQSIEALGFDKLVIVQPGLLLRPGTERLVEKLSVKMLSVFNKVGMLKQYAPTHVDQVAAAMIQHALSGRSGICRVKNKEITGHRD
ncbi:NAD(P)H-binding protein [Paludibacter jiangxiensis]|uniref:NAD(P)H-binding n=1 Tax=Paludibacter jiangxiensis TaxID=681398 RepID=A0A161LX43_9BACT|nr:NAD(P)H-binding protein [Paludibacter jiangxiensis]GAT63962.1 NAD(P)H-binding [Paludibacter jiangxiensis]